MSIMNRLRNIFEAKETIVDPNEQSEVIFRNTVEIECPICRDVNFCIDRADKFVTFECWDCGYVLEYDW